MTKTLKRVAMASAVSSGLLYSALTALAAVSVVTIPTGPTSITGLLTQVCTVVNLIFTVLLILAIIFILFAAFSYLTAGGDPEKVKGASRQVLYAAVAVVVAVLAKAIPIAVSAFVLGSTGITTC